MIDSHAHINPVDVSNIDNTIDMINKLDYLNYVINVGLDYETSKYVINLANSNKKFYSIIGIHPLKMGKLEDIYNLYNSFNSEKIVGIGETGIDISIKNPLLVAIEEQEKKFHDSIDIANMFNIPIVIHSNNSNEKCLEIIKSHKPTNGFLFHCFEPDLKILDEIMDMGGFISVGSPITKINAKKSLEVIKLVDINRLLIETDYPYMSENFIKDGKNIFNKIREIRQMEYMELESIIDQNTKRLFRKLGN